VSLRSERATVQTPLVRYATEAGWTCLAPDEALRLRRGDGGLVLQEVLHQQLLRLNPGVVDLTRAEDLVARLVRVPPTEEVAYSDGIHRIRPDVVFLVNGIPLLQVETKAATRLEGIAEALERSWFSSTRPRRYWGRPASSPTSARKPWSGWPGRTSRTQ
jgi:type I restriction enzyme, R subunit